MLRLGSEAFQLQSVLAQLFFATHLFRGLADLSLNQAVLYFTHLEIVLILIGQFIEQVHRFFLEHFSSR